MRSRSIVGPLVLIVIGCLFFLRNLHPEIELFTFFSRYWPFLLIAWGFLKLVEVLVWQVRGQSIPRAGVSGGEWTLVVLLCVFGTLFFWGSHWSGRWPGRNIRVSGVELFGEPFDFPVATERHVGKTPRLILEMARGNVKITGADTETVKVTGHKTIRAYQQSDADQTNKQTPLEIVVMGDQTIIRTNGDKVDNSRRFTTDLEIVVPKGSRFEGRGKYGDFDVHDLNGDVEINSENAGVRVQNISGSLKVDLRRSDMIRAVNVKGNVDVKGRGQDIELDTVEGTASVSGAYSGELTFRNIAKPLRFDGVQSDLRVEKVPGTIRIGLGRLLLENIQGPARVSTKSRDVQVRDFTGPLDVTIDRGDLELRPSAQMGKVDARTTNGDIVLSVPALAKFDLVATTARGEVENGYGPPLQRDSSGKGGSIRGSNGAGPTLHVSTERGSVTVRRAGAADVQAPTPVLPKTPVPPKAPVQVPAPVSQ